MNAERLIEWFERVADAPDAVARLRRFVLDLAVRGRLVEQDPADEPASELLNRIAAEKARLVKLGASKKEKPFFAGSSSEQPFTLPSSWEWVPATYPAYGVSDQGQKVKTADVLVSGAFPVVDQGKILVRGYCNEPLKLIKVSEPVIVFGDHTRETKLIDFDFVVGADGVKILHPVCISAQYYFFALQWLPLDSRGYGRHFKLLKASRIPLPPLAEQHRIVQRVDELMALCDQLEAAQATRDQHRDRLNTVALKRLVDAEPGDESREAARFYLNRLPRVVRTVEQVKALRQTVLDLAVRGKLTRQENDAETSCTSIPRASSSKNTVRRRGVPNIVEKSALVMGWRLPQPWKIISAAEMIRAGVIIELKDGNHGVNHPKKAEFTEDGIAFVTAAQVKDHEIDYLGSYKLSGEPLNRLKVGFAEAEDVILTHKGTVGRTAVARHSCILSPQTTYYRLNSELVHNRYLMWFMESDLFASQLNEIKKQTTRDFIPISRQYSLFHVLPPLAEQYDIVQRVDELVALCDQIEDSIVAQNTATTGLLNALIAEALADSPDPAMVEQQAQPALHG